VTQVTSRADWAIRYTGELGWPALPLHHVIEGRCSCGRAECASPGKHPRLPHGLHEASTDPDTVRRWWDRWTDAHIGLRTGDCFDVLDVDGEAGITSLKEAVAANEPLPPGPAVTTGGGGLHLYFAPTGIGNRAGFLPSVDWRGRGGYVVAPPSGHLSGGDYTWEDEPTGPLPTAPQWLLDVLDPPRPTRAAPANPLPRSGPPGGAYGQSALDREVAELARAPEGMRNHQLNLCGYNLYQLVAGGELPEEAVEDQLRRTGIMIGLRPSEVDATIASARAAGLAQPRRAPPSRFTPRSNGNGHRPAGRLIVEEPPPPGDEDAPPAPGTAGRPAKHNLTDVGNAGRLVEAHGPDLRHVRPWASWLAWDGARWKRDDTGVVVEQAKKVARSILTEAAMEDDPDRRKALAGWARQSENAARIHAMINLAGSDPAVATRPDELDLDAWLLTVANGTIDLCSGTLLRHQRDHRITKLAGVTWDPAATCPTWDAFLARVLPDPAVRAFVRRAVGYSLTGSVREQCLFFLYGLGANGKSTLITTLLTLLGDYGRQADPKLLMEQKHETHPTNVADLQGARFVAAIEAGSGGRLDETLVKQLTGGDRVKARFMRQDFFEFNPTHKLFLAANHKPVIRGNDHAIWRRVHLIPFSVKIAEREKDDRLGGKLEAELPGILRWAVEGCLEWQSGGLQVPGGVAEATDAYRVEEDLLGDFLEQCCLEEPGAEVPATELYRAYQRWTEAGGERTWSQTAFGRALSERGIDWKKVSGGRKARIGLRLLTQGV
jgi:P4 family phage/plasmid primase-like protien